MFKRLTVQSCSLNNDDGSKRYKLVQRKLRIPSFEVGILHLANFLHHLTHLLVAAIFYNHGSDKQSFDWNWGVRVPESIAYFSVHSAISTRALGCLPRLSLLAR